MRRRVILPDPWVPDTTYAPLRCFGTNAQWVNGTLVATNNRALYLPVVFPADCTLYAMYFAAGNGTGNYDLGLYDGAKTRLRSSGSTALSAAGLKTLTFSPEVRVKGGCLYYAAIAFSDTLGQLYRSTVATAATAVGTGMAQEDSALPLPATATPVAVSQTTIPAIAFGIR